MDYKDITAAEIMDAYDNGKQVIFVNHRQSRISLIVFIAVQRFAVVVLRCVRYDEGFQRELTQKFETWVPQAPNGPAKKSKPKSKTVKRQ